VYSVKLARRSSSETDDALGGVATMSPVAVADRMVPPSPAPAPAGPDRRASPPPMAATPTSPEPMTPAPARPEAAAPTLGPPPPPPQRSSTEAQPTESDEDDSTRNRLLHDVVTLRESIDSIRRLLDRLLYPDSGIIDVREKEEAPAKQEATDRD
jgi:hypothetical protein